jgi:zinc transporter 9
MNLENFWMLLLLLTAMGVGSFLAGNIPLTLQLSNDNLDLVSCFGAGLLIGAVFMIIIPEGVETVYKSKDIPYAILSNNTDRKKDEQHDSSFDKPIGISLLVGFSFMLLVDQLSNSHGSHHQAIPISVNDLRDHEYRFHYTPTPTLGLVIHAMADGIAMGAAFISNQSHLEWVLFFAILLHKAPTAFGLTSFLLQKGLPKRKILKHLSIFSLSTPISSILTYLAIGAQDHHTLQFKTGLLLLFSAGTFVYVATVHILPEIGSDNHKKLTKKQICILVLGMFAPMLLSMDVLLDLHSTNINDVHDSSIIVIIYLVKAAIISI